TNQFDDVLAVVVRRLAVPMASIAEQVSAVQAGCGEPRPPLGPDGCPEVGSTPCGALLPTDPGIRDAYLTHRAAALRNAVGRARAVNRPGEVAICVLDADAERWPW